MKILYIMLAVILSAACSDFLDVKPVGKLIPTEVEEYENLLNHQATVSYYYLDAGSSYLSHLTDNLAISKNAATYYFTPGLSSLSLYAAYTFQKPYDEPDAKDFFWENGTYKAAGIFNNVIEGVKDVRTPETAVLADRLTSQAKAGRAWAYLTMAMIYGPVYDPAGANATRTIPYRTSPQPLVANPDLSTTAEVFALVKKDIEDALEFAPANVSNPSRFSLPAVQALMAYYYMFTRDWNNMLKYADLAWTSSLAQKGGVEKMIYNYNHFSYATDGAIRDEDKPDPEVSLAIQGEDGMIQQSSHRENLMFRMPAYGGKGEVYPSADFLNLFDPALDLRYKLFALRDNGFSKKVGDVTYDDGIVVMYFRNDKVMANQGFTYPELLLMRAEAYARINDKTNALEDLNTLRKFRYKGTETDLPQGAALSQDELLYEILKERRRELPIATFQRLLDLKRLSLDTGKPWCKTKIDHQIGDRTYSADLNSDAFILSVPNTVILLNPQWGLEPEKREFNPLNVN